MSEYDLDPLFAPLFAALETVSHPRDYSNVAIDLLTTDGAAAARIASIAPEAMIAYLRARLNATPLYGVGDWYRGALVDRIVACAINGYYRDQTPA